LKENSDKPTIIFVHGAWHGKGSWDQFVEYFTDQGYDCVAFNFPGHDGDQPFGYRFNGIGSYVKNLEEVAAKYKNPILVGHSVGGLVIQKYLEINSAGAAILLASVPFDGIPWSTISKLLVQHFDILLKVGLLQTVPVKDQSIARKFFYQENTPAKIVEKNYQSLVPETPLTLLRISLSGKLWLSPFKVKDSSIPRLMLYGDRDYFMTVGSQERLSKKWDCEAKLLPGFSHNMMDEQNWEQVADKINDWLKANLPVK